MKCEEKIKYKSKKEAERIKKNPHYKRKMRVYLCPECHSWHLSESFKKRLIKKIENRNI